MKVFLMLTVLIASSDAKPVPVFPKMWSAHENNVAIIEGTHAKWEGRSYTDFTMQSLPGCTLPTHKDHPMNCTANVLIDDHHLTGRNVWSFYDPHAAYRGATYFQEATQTPCWCEMDDESADFDPCQAADSLCAEGMVQHGKVTEGTLNGAKVDQIDWIDTLVIASQRFRLSVVPDTTTVLQIYSTFFNRVKTVGNSTIDMTNFTAARPPATVFDVPKFKYAAACDDQQCGDYKMNRKNGMHPVHAFKWKA